MKKDSTTTGPEACLMFSDIDEFIAWGAFANEFFNKPASWFYDRMDGGADGHGRSTFSIEERKQLKAALFNLA